ncbi:unnamed protein product [Diatraea saccharalis]|uniref:MADF domain-containing protein n=1 Tax=Diatraea saccharalis TaxID=40085 RepID=A0A9N9R5W7_9NEOP|nr:unnamed protein product [Diatraea saccharalis]
MNFDTEKFIVEIKNRPCIWDSTSTDYSDRNLKIKSWDEIVDIFKEKEVMTIQEKKVLVDTLQKRWKSIRGCFTRELNRQKSLKAGTSSGPRKSEYMFFKQLLFLQKVVALREPEVTATDSDSESQQDRQMINFAKRPKTKETAPEDDKFLEALDKIIKTRKRHEMGSQDEDRLFMLSLVSSLKKVPPQRKMSTKIKIMTVLEEAACFETDTDDSS